MLKMCEQTDCLPVAGHSTLLAQSQPTAPSSPTEFGARPTLFSLVSGITTVPVFDSHARSAGSISKSVTMTRAMKEYL